MARRQALALGTLTLLASCVIARTNTTVSPNRFIDEASGIEFVLVPATPSFYIGTTEVTTGQFRRFVEATGYKTDAERGVDDGNGNGVGTFTALPQGEREWSKITTWRTAFDRFPDFKLSDDHPAMHVSWNDAQAFAKHYGLRLPTAGEWEIAARARVKTLYPWGDEPLGGAGWANVRDQSAAKVYGQAEICFPFDDGTPVVAKVAHYKPNAWGLYDVIGNVAEWVDGSANGARTLKGGAWNDYPEGASLKSRAGMTAASRRDFIGFRVAIDRPHVR
jgi:formylglycine-generating enzyme required for sulfatase activity